MKKGFTLIEMLVVIGIIAILAAILLPAVGRARRAALEAQAKAEVKSIETAIKSYVSQYSGRFPHDNGSADRTYTTDNNELMNVLRSIDGSGNPGNQNNIRKIVFLEVGEKSLDDSDNFIDPWEQPYQITVDTDFNNECDVPGVPNPVPRNVCVWSIGPDAAASWTNWINSWQ